MATKRATIRRPPGPDAVLPDPARATAAPEAANTAQPPVVRRTVEELREAAITTTAGRMNGHARRVAGKSGVIEYRCGLDPQATDYLARSTRGGWYKICHFDVLAEVANLDPESGFGWREFAKPGSPTALVLDGAMTLAFGGLVQDDEVEEGEGDAALSARRTRKKGGAPRKNTRPLRVTPASLATIRESFRQHKHLARRNLDGNVWVSSGFVLWAKENGAPQHAGTGPLFALCKEHERGLTVFAIPTSETAMMLALCDVVAPFQSPSVEQLRQRYGVLRYEWAALIDAQLRAHNIAAAPKPPARRKAATVPIAKTN